MKNKNIPFLLLAVVINDSCGTEGTNTHKNTGGKTQNVEGAVRTYALATEAFEFVTAAEARSEAAWNTAKEAKDVVVFYDIEELTPANTEAIKKEGRYRTYSIKDAIKGVEYTHYLSTCSHEAVKSYDESPVYTRVFRITDKGEILCEAQDDGSIKGEPLSSFIVGIRDDAPVDGTPSTKVNFKFKDYALSVLKANFDIAELEGIYDVDVDVVSASATEIVFTAKDGCCGDNIKTFEAGDFIVKDLAGEEHASVLTGPNASNQYTLTGTGFATGFTVDGNGVIVESDVMYEVVEPQAITVS